MMTLESLGRMVADKRGDLGIRAAARQIGVSASTLSRVERGHLPDLENYQKICNWLGIDTEDVVGKTFARQESDVARVHFRKSRTVSKETALALAELILAAQRAIQLQDGE